MTYRLCLHGTPSYYRESKMPLSKRYAELYRGTTRATIRKMSKIITAKIKTTKQRKAHMLPRPMADPTQGHT